MVRVGQACNSTAFVYDKPPVESRLRARGTNLTAAAAPSTTRNDRERPITSKEDEGFGRRHSRIVYCAAGNTCTSTPDG
jgi:hypothetical protein